MPATRLFYSWGVGVKIPKLGKDLKSRQSLPDSYSIGTGLVHSTNVRYMNAATRSDHFNNDPIRIDPLNNNPIKLS